MKLLIESAICDLRKAQEETLAAYDNITIQSALLITNPRARALLAKYPFTLQCAQTLDLEDDIQLNTINGQTILTGQNTPNGKQFLIINGTLTVTPDAGDALRQYMGITLNGAAYCPTSLATVLASKSTINGKLYSYPDHAVVLKSTTVLDRNFLYRAQNRLYWAAKRFITVDEKLDGGALAATGARFTSPSAILSEGLAKDLAPLFDEATQLEIVPDGTQVVQDDLELNDAALGRYGEALYIAGDLTLADDCEEGLNSLEYLHVEGDVILPGDLADALYDIPDFACGGEVILLDGHPISCKSRVKVDEALLDLYPDGVSLLNCALVEIDPALEPSEILEQLYLSNCALVRCTAAQQGAVQAAGGAARIQLTDQATEEEAPDEDTQIFECAQYVL